MPPYLTPKIAEVEDFVNFFAFNAFLYKNLDICLKECYDVLKMENSQGGKQMAAPLMVGPEKITKKVSKADELQELEELAYVDRELLKVLVARKGRGSFIW